MGFTLILYVIIRMKIIINNKIFNIRTKKKCLFSTKFELFYNDFELFMIVYSKSEKRLDNYKTQANKLNNNLNKFEAIDTMNKNLFNYFKYYAIKEKYMNDEYIKKVTLNGEYPGKIGVVLSHTNLWKKIYNNDNKTKWYLIVEDDINISEKLPIFLYNIINLIPKKCQFVRFYVHPEFYEKQFSEKYHIKYNMYKMMPDQWGNIAYFITKKGIKILLNNIFPLNGSFFDSTISKCSKLNAIVIKNNIFQNLGASYGNDGNSKLGSIIWNT